MVAALGGASLAAAACGVGGAGDAKEAPAAKPATVSYWRYYANPPRLEAEAGLFKHLSERYPGLTVQELQGNAQIDDSMVTAFASGTPPDVWTTAPTVYHPYTKDHLLQLNDRIKKDLDQKKLFWESMAEWESPTGSGQLFGITRDFNVTVFLFNKEMFQTAGVPLPDANWTYEQIGVHGSKFVKNGESKDEGIWAFGATADRTVWDPAVRANGGQVLNKQRTRAVMESDPRTLATLEQWIAWNARARLSPAPELGLGAPGPLFYGGRLAMLQTLASFVPQVVQRAPSMKWDLTVVPKGSAKREVYGGPDGLAVSRASKVPDAAWRVVQGFFLPQSMPFHLAWGGIPMSRDLAALPEWRDQEPKGHTKVLLEAVPSLSADFNREYVKWHAAKTEVLNEALNGKLAARDALRRANDAINQILVQAYPTA
jgi:multiple sugar transport system substrate-binding protein